MEIYSNNKYCAKHCLLYRLICMESDDDYPYDFMDNSHDLDASRQADKVQQSKLISQNFRFTYPLI